MTIEYKIHKYALKKQKQYDTPRNNSGKIKFNQ